tara:strand:+ start:763 stop:1071 length:309 start_codon:yes stop_codon:yes gene_type:complete
MTGSRKRDYKAEYAKYQGTEEQKKKRAQRNKARRKAMREGKVSKGDGKDVAHVKAMDKGGKNSDGTKVETASRNRSFKRDAKGNLVSETSSRERKKRKTSTA